MSSKGNQNNQKHGGAHGSTHVYNSGSMKFVIGENQIVYNSVKPTILLSDQNGTSVSLAQDGVEEDRRQTELEAFIDNHSTELAFEDGGNAEWITTTVDELGNIAFDPLGLSESHDASKSKISDAIFDVVENSLAPEDPAASFVESNPHLKIKLESGVGAKSSPCSPVHSFIKQEGLGSSTTGRQRSFSDSEEQLTAQDRACLEEIERGSQLTLEDQELIEDSKQRLQLELQDFDTTTDKSSSLMTPQELQTLQDRGLDFDANDNPQMSDDLVPAEETNPISPSQLIQGSEPNPTVATISITTNKKENSTEIIIDTKSGKQVFQLSTADFNSAAGSNVRLVGDDGTIQNIFLGGCEDGVASAVSTEPVQPKRREKPKSAQQSTSNAVRDASRSHMCQECGQFFAKPFKLRLHVMGHRGEKPFKCTEPGCDWAFSTSYKLKRHVECHEGKKEFKCMEPDCGRHFTTIYNLASHQKLHERPLTELCPVEGCNEAFANKKLRDTHLKTHGDAGRQYRCPHPGCDKLFYSELTMGSHKKMHQRSEPIRCTFPDCNRTFDKPSRLTAHMRTHTGERPYHCTVEGCNWSFPTASKLRRHLNKHTGERKFACEHQGCGKLFMRPEHLKGHMVVHSKDKPFTCSVQGCNSSFTAKSSWYVHVKKHEQRREDIVYYCPIDGCVRKYKDKVGLRAHIEKHYGKDAGGGAADDSKRAAVLALVNGDIGALIAANGGVVDQDELEQSLASIIDPPPATPVPICPAPSPTSLAAANLLNDPTAGIVVTTADGPAFVTYADLIASGVDLTDLGLVSSPPAVSMEESVDLSTAAGTLTTTTTSLPAAAPTVIQPTPPPPPLAPPPQQSLLKRNMPQLQQQPPPKKQCVSLPSTSTKPPPVDDCGCARTDFTRNHLLSTRAKQRRHILTQKSAAADGGMQLSDNSSLQNDVNLSLPGNSLLDSTDLLGVPASPSSSQALSIDPETGVIYMQTRLLQDDPPETSLLGEASMSSLLHDPHQLVSGGDMAMDTSSPPTSVFTGSTINLHDLQG